MTPTRLYLDVDGCVSALDTPDPAWGPFERATVRLNYGDGMIGDYAVAWAPALVLALDRLRADHALDLVFVTTWNDVDGAREELVPVLHGLGGARILPPTPGPRKPGETKGWWKAERILQDQTASPSPFIWVDDKEVPLHGDTVQSETAGTTSLAIAPDGLIGLTVDHLATMTAWLKALAATHAGAGTR